MDFSLDPYNLNTFPDIGFIRTGHQPPWPHWNNQTYIKNIINFTTDTELSQYKTIKSVLSDKYWKYADPEFVSYEFNSEGFREKEEFDNIDWKNTSAVVGCSYTMGHCCENEHTISQILTREYGMPFVNGGQPGAGNRTIHNNAITFMKKYNPKNVVIIWSYHARYAWLTIDKDNNQNYWNATHYTPQDSKAERKDAIRNRGVPSSYFDSVSYDSIHQWKNAIDIHNLLGNKQYSVSEKYEKMNSHNNDALWIKPKDTTLYEKLFMPNDISPGPTYTPADLQTPEPYELINKMCSRDVKWDPYSNILHLNHYGEQMNRDIADLIYRENFK